MLIGVLGKKMHGKDTIANYMCTFYKFQRIAFADTLKQTCASLFGFTYRQLYKDKKEEVDPTWGITPREAMQYMGTEVVRKGMSNLIPGIGENFWIKCMEKRLKDCYSNTNVVISDVRFQNEVDFIHSMGGKVIKVEREFEEESLNFVNHESELAIDKITNYDFLVHNKELEDLYSYIDSIMILKLDLERRVI